MRTVGLTEVKLKKSLKQTKPANKAGGKKRDED